MINDKLNDIVGIVKFIIILDNYGKRIFSRYYITEEDYTNSNLKNEAEQKNFENRICLYTQTINVDHIEVDIFNYEKFVIVSKIYNEIAIFIGCNEDENENLIMHFFNVFEEILLEIVETKMTKQKIMDKYEYIIALVDEMVNEGIVMNLNGEKINKLVHLKEESKKSFFNFSEQKKASKSLFGSIMSGAKSYLTKSLNS